MEIQQRKTGLPHGCKEIVENRTLGKKEVEAASGTPRFKDFLFKEPLNKSELHGSPNIMSLFSTPQISETNSSVVPLWPLVESYGNLQGPRIQSLFSEF